MNRETTHRMIETNGIRMHIAEQGRGPLVLLLHGFPECWYSWRHQLRALAEVGFHAVAPDVRGYGRTDAPESIEGYSMLEQCADAVGILDALEEETAVLVGHDWGATNAWSCVRLYPQRFRAIAALSVPFPPRGPAPPIQTMRQLAPDTFIYLVYFQEPGLAEAELEADPRRTLRTFLYSASGDAPPGTGLAPKPKDAKWLDGMVDPETLPAWLTEQDLNHYAQEFERTGFRGGLNRYRNIDRDWRELSHLEDVQVQQPALFVGGDRDGVLTMIGLDAMKTFVPNLRKTVVLPGCGHWTQQERPAEVNAELIEFLNDLSAVR
jgi:pimeloyl-ACP methyl ester carboxylesterase